jgi:hypothetical protein
MSHPEDLLARVPKHRGMAKQQSRYLVYVRRAWTFDTLGSKIEDVLEPLPQDHIVSIDTRVDFQFFWPFRRNAAVIVARRPDAWYDPA